MGNSLNSIIYQPPLPATYVKEDVVQFVGSGKDQLAVVYVRTPSRKAPGTEPILVLYSHGNAEDLGGVHSLLESLSEDLADRGLSNIVAAYDYSGYGQSSGTPSESTVFRNAQDVLEALMSENNIPADRVIVWGRSLGSGPTCFLANTAASKNRKPFAGVVLQSPLLSIYRVGLGSASYFRLPFDQFCNYERVRSGFGEKTRVFVIHGTVDTVVPFLHGKTIHDCIPATNQHPPLFVEGAGHNDVEHKVYNQQVLKSTREDQRRTLTSHVASFIEQCFITAA